MEPEQAAALIYSPYYYKSLRDESSDAQLTIIVPALICNEMHSKKTVTVNGFITKRMVTMPAASISS
jgi:exodeoxyribonuclease VII large subunit